MDNKNVLSKTNTNKNNFQYFEIRVPSIFNQKLKCLLNFKSLSDKMILRDMPVFVYLEESSWPCTIRSDKDRLTKANRRSTG